MKKPNLLYIFTDQQRPDTMACYGNTQIETPALNQLADESFVFEHAYVSQPVCSPSRATMLCGLYPHTARVPACNVRLPNEVQTVAEMVSDDYRCAYMGKWHLGNEIFPQHGFTEWVGTEDSYRQFFSSPDLHEQVSDYHRFLSEQGMVPDSESFGEPVFSRHFEASQEEALTKAAYQGDRAAQFIRESGEDPFVLAVSYLEPHPPHMGPLNEYYDPWKLPTGPHFRIRPPANASLLNRVLSAYYMESQEEGYDLRTEEGWRRIRGRYWGNVTLVDRSVAKILRALEESGKADETIVVFTSDHGEMVGDHGILGKTVLYEESVKVPLLIRVPWLGRHQRRIDGNFGHIDLVPTILDLMGQAVPDHLEGVSRKEVLDGEATLADNDVFIQWNRSDGHPRAGEAAVNPPMATPWRSVVSADRWKLNLSAHDQCELYDLNTDPYEMVNLFDVPEQRDCVQDLARRIGAWQAAFGDRVVLPQGL
ncbi:MAG: sulfatase-like hydrolase/transferase [bacterium]|nr:sulfatase-like hydrolase/transferase [bacterium]